MRFSKSASIIAALAMATTGALALSQKDADAASVATVTSSSSARLYTSNGVMVDNRALAPNSPWLVGKIATINGETMYQVATNEYLRARDSSLNTNTAAQTKNKLVGKLVAGGSLLYRDDTKELSNRMLDNGSTWLIGKHIVNKYNQHFVQVSTHEYADGSLMLFNQPVPEGTYIADFGVSVGDHSDSNWSDTSTSDNNNSNNNGNTIDTNTSDNNTDNSNNSNNTTDTNTSDNNDTSSDNNTSAYKPNLENINKYFVAYLNALHKANGTAPVQLSSSMMSYAQQRAGQQDGQNLDHSTATQNTSENLSSAGFSFMNYAGVKSDKDAAYFLLKEWYDESNNLYGVGQPGHFGHRAALIYSGPNVGLGITNGDAAFDADWNHSTLNAQNQMYYSTSEPNTQFISKDAI